MADQKVPAVLLFGAPGVGKGTQGKILGSVPGFHHLSCGDVFRAIDISSDEGNQIYPFISNGELVPDDLTIRLWEKRLNALVTLATIKPMQDVLILDGIPRNVAQAEYLKKSVNVLQVISLSCSDEEAMIKRIKQRAVRENRTDDASDEIIRNRFDIYRKETSPVLSFYPESIITQIDAIGSPIEILNKILNCLIPICQKHFQQN